MSARRSVQPSVQHEGAIFDTLCTIRDLGQPRGLPVAQHVCDNLSKAWHRKRSTPQPFLDVAVKAVPDDYEALGFALSSPSKTCSIPAMADTGCQSCLAGLKVIHRLGLRLQDLIPFTMEMHTATDGGIPILGAVPLRISGKDPLGHIVESRQLTYITDTSISESFPTLGMTQGTHQPDVAATLKEPVHALGVSSPHHPLLNCHSLRLRRTVRSCNIIYLPTTNQAHLIRASISPCH